MLILFALVLTTMTGAAAQTPDILLLNGKILTVDAADHQVEALAIAGSRILATGTSDDLRKLAGPQTQIVDLAGRTVIPGLTDAHIHAIRAALTYSIEVSWFGVPTLAEALARLKAAAENAPPDGWIIVAGGWVDRQFAEKRKPSQAELVAAAGGRPVYLQHLYNWVMLTPAAMQRLNIGADSDLPKFGTFERDSEGRPTGGILGNGVTFLDLFNRLPHPSAAQAIDGTKAFFHELNRLGLTGLIDPAGVSVGPESYKPLFTLWQSGALTLRVAYHVSSQKPGAELADYESLLQLLPSGFGDDMLRFNGIGEIVTWGVWTDGDPTPEAFAKLEDVLAWAAAHRMGLQIHWNPQRSVDRLFDIMERVNAKTPIGDLRWTIDHLYDASDRSLARMKTLDIAWDVQDSLYFNGTAFAAAQGDAIARRSPPIRNALSIGLRVVAGTDAHRVSDYNPFISLRWLVTGKTIDGATVLGADQHPSRAEALRLYTMNSAWLAHAETQRGSLEPGKYADLAVLSADYMSVPDAEIGAIHSLLTLLGGRPVYAEGAYAALAAPAGR